MIKLLLLKTYILIFERIKQVQILIVGGLTMSYLMGIDLGTSSVKTLIIDLEGTIKGIGQEDYRFDIPCEGYAEQHPETWWKATVNTIREALRMSGIPAGEIKCIGFSGQMHGMVLIDKNLNVVRPAIIWCDQRSKQQVEEIYEKVGRDELGRITLNPVATGFQTPSLLWVKQNEPENYANTFKVLLPKDYIRLKLTGEIGTDITDASSTLAFETGEGKWSEELLRILGLDVEKYPLCKMPFEIAGTVTQEAARETDLKPGTKVVFGGGDQPMQAVGNGIVSPGTVSSTIGTGSIIFTPSDKPLYDKQLRMHTFSNAVPKMWSIMGATLCGGLSLRWLKDNIIRSKDYKSIDANAEIIPAGSEGLLFLPYLGGERTPHMDPYARGIFFGMTYKHTHGHMARAVMEGVAFALRDSLEIFRNLGIKTNKVIASGGGAKSPLWLQIQADIFNQEVYTTKMTEQACTGAAIMAGVGSGCYSTVQEACGQIVKHNSEPVVPDHNNAKIYDYYFDIYKELYERNKDLFRKMTIND